MSRLPRAPSEAVIEVRGLCNRFGSQSVHENLDLDLYKGEILAVMANDVNAGRNIHRENRNAGSIDRIHQSLIFS